jgi:hypothetical protein
MKWPSGMFRPKALYRSPLKMFAAHFQCRTRKNNRNEGNTAGLGKRDNMAGVRCHRPAAANIIKVGRCYKGIPGRPAPPISPANVTFSPIFPTCA